MNRDNQLISKNTPNQGQLVRQEVAVSFSGPLPPPEALKRYDEIVPGAAERIIKMAEQQAEHRRSLEQQVIKSEIKNSKLGIYFGFTIGIVGIIGAIVVAILGKQKFGGVIGLASLASLVGVFIYGSKSRKDELKEKK
jgi:uncharacterized membrane protein